MKLEITKEKVLEAASKCSEAKEILKTLFPEVFDGGRDVFKKDYNEKSDLVLAWNSDGNSVVLLGSGVGDDMPAHTYFYLDSGYTWQIKDGKYLIPTKK
jgi:hypothetical protein